MVHVSQSDTGYDLGLAQSLGRKISALFIKLMQRLIPVKLLDLLVNWLSNCWSCIKWNDKFSDCFIISFGVRQGSVLSPYLFAVYVNDVAKCHAGSVNSFVVLYADDILLISSSVSVLQTMLVACEIELDWLNMGINHKKSTCIRIGPRCDMMPSPICTRSGQTLLWDTMIKYLGVVILRSRKFKCSFNESKKSFYRALNAILGRVGAIASEEVVIHLVSCKCLPILLYGTESCPLNKTQLASFDFVFTRFLMKLFRTIDKNVISVCINFFEISLPSALIAMRKAKFDRKFVAIPLLAMDRCVH